MTEKELQEYEVPSIYSEKELLDFINKMIVCGNSYQTAPYSMALSAYAVFNYVAQKLQVTEYQAEFADLEFIKRTRGMEDGFVIIDYENLLYPQYKDEFNKYSFNNLLKRNLPHLKERAKELLKKDSGFAHENVIKHWKMIVELGEKTNDFIFN